MKLQEIFDQLTYGEFSQLSIGGAAAGVIDETNYAHVLGHVNLGLVDLFKRFTIKEGRIQLALQPNQTLYKLVSSNAVNARRSTAPVRYIVDTVDDPFTDDILKIERVLTDCGYEMPLNDSGECYSVFTPSALQLRIPEILVNGAINIPKELKTLGLTVVYRANHPKVVVPVGYFDPTRVEIQLPDSHLSALLLYVASRAQAPVGMGNEFNASNSYFARYQSACQELENQGLQVDHANSSTRLQRNGWA